MNYENMMNNYWIARFPNWEMGQVKGPQCPPLLRFKEKIYYCSTETAGGYKELSDVLILKDFENLIPEANPNQDEW